MSAPRVSVIISNKNGVQWLPRCFASLRSQTLFEDLEIIVVDNCSADGSAALARRELAAFPKATVIENPVDLGYAGGSDVGAEAAQGEFFFILGNDTWLEPDCIEQIIKAMQTAPADAAIPTVAGYRSNTVVPSPLGFDLTGRPTGSEGAAAASSQPGPWPHCFMVAGPGFMFRREVWRKIGGFDAKLFMYAEDDDISWKLWLAGFQGIQVKNAVLHHRDDTGEIRAATRYLANRNSLIVLAKNAQHLLLLCLSLQILLLIAEAFFFLIVRRNWKFVWHGYFKALIDACKFAPHVLEMRRFNRRIRRLSDWKMARKFMRFKINRWDMMKAFLSGRLTAARPSG
jgi:GT2 family glycosyltransferase